MYFFKYNKSFIYSKLIIKKLILNILYLKHKNIFSEYLKLKILLKTNINNLYVKHKQIVIFV